MAQQTNGFSRITVHTDDDEVVIQAGIRPATNEGQAAQNQGNEEAEAREASPAFATAETAEDAESGAAPTSTADAKPATAASNGAPQPQATRIAPARSAKKAYRETTADDLDVGPMPVAQKVVIVVAVLLIAGFLVYYNFLR